MAFLTNKLFDILINSNHFNADNDNVELSLTPSEFATRLKLLQEYDEQELKNELYDIGYDVVTSYGTGESQLLNPSPDPIVANITTTFSIPDMNPEDTEEAFEFGEFDPRNLNWNFGHDMLGYVVQQLQSGTSGIIELQPGVNHHIVFYNINPTPIGDIFANEIAAPPIGVGGNLLKIETEAEPFSLYTTQTGITGLTTFDTDLGYSASTLGGLADGFKNHIFRNQKYTITVQEAVTIDYSSFQTIGNPDNPVVNIRQKGHAFKTDRGPLDIIHDRSIYPTQHHSTIAMEASWKNMGEPNIDLVRYNWDSIKFYCMLLRDGGSPIGMINRFMEQDPDGPFFHQLSGILNNPGIIMRTPPTRRQRDLFLYYKQHVEGYAAINIPSAVGTGNAEPWQLRNYWDVLNLGIALPAGNGTTLDGRNYTETLTQYDRFLKKHGQDHDLDGAIAPHKEEKIRKGCSLRLSSPKFVSNVPGAGDSYWDERIFTPITPVAADQSEIILGFWNGGYAYDGPTEAFRLYAEMHDYSSNNGVGGWQDNNDSPYWDENAEIRGLRLWHGTGYNISGPAFGEGNISADITNRERLRYEIMFELDMLDQYNDSTIVPEDSIEIEEIRIKMTPMPGGTMAGITSHNGYVHGINGYNNEPASGWSWDQVAPNGSNIASSVKEIRFEKGTGWSIDSSINSFKTNWAENGVVPGNGVIKLPWRGELSSAHKLYNFDDDSNSEGYSQLFVELDEGTNTGFNGSVHFRVTYSITSGQTYSVSGITVDSDANDNMKSATITKTGWEEGNTGFMRCNWTGNYNPVEYLMGPFAGFEGGGTHRGFPENGRWRVRFGNTADYIDCNVSHVIDPRPGPEPRSWVGNIATGDYDVGPAEQYGSLTWGPNEPRLHLRPGWFNQDNNNFDSNDVIMLTNGTHIELCTVVTQDGNNPNWKEYRFPGGGGSTITVEFVTLLVTRGQFGTTARTWDLEDTSVLKVDITTRRWESGRAPLDLTDLQPNEVRVIIDGWDGEGLHEGDLSTFNQKWINGTDHPTGTTVFFEPGTLSATTGLYSESTYDVPYVYSSNVSQAPPGSSTLFNPVIRTAALAQLGIDSDVLDSKFIKDTGTKHQNFGLHSWINPIDHPEDDRGFEGVTVAPGLIMYREILGPYTSGIANNVDAMGWSGIMASDYLKSNLFNALGTKTNQLTDDQGDGEDSGLYWRIMNNTNTEQGGGLLWGYSTDVSGLNNASPWMVKGIGPGLIVEDVPIEKIQYDGTGDEVGFSMAGRWHVKQITPSPGYDSFETALSVILYDYMMRYASEPGNVNIIYRGTSVSYDPVNRTARFPYTGEGLITIQFPQSAALNAIDVPVTTNTVVPDNINEKIIKSGNLAKDFSQNLFGGSFNFKLATTLDEETSADPDSPKFNRIIPNLLNDLYSHGIDSSCLTLIGQGTPSPNFPGIFPQKNLGTYYSTDIPGYQLYNENLLTGLTSTNAKKRMFPHSADPLSQRRVADGSRGNQDREVDVNSLNSHLSTYEENLQPLVQRKFRIRSLHDAPGGSVNPSFWPAGYIGSLYAVSFNTDVIPIQDQIYTFSTKVKLTEGFKVTMGIRKYSVDPQHPAITNLQTLTDDLDITAIEKWFDLPEGKHGARDLYGDLDSERFNSIKNIAIEHGLNKIPNEYQPIEFACNANLTHGANLPPGGNFDNYEAMIEQRIRDNFLTHTTVTGDLVPEWSGIHISSTYGKVYPMHTTFIQTDAVFKNHRGTTKAPFIPMAPYESGQSIGEFKYQAGGVQVLFLIYFDVDYLRNNSISSDFTEWYDWANEQTMDFEIMEPKLSLQDEYKEGPYTNQPRIGPTIWSDSEGFNPNKDGWIPQESVYADYGMRTILQIYHADNISNSGKVAGTTWYGEFTRGRNSTSYIGENVKGLSVFKKTGLDHTFDNNGDYVLRVTVDDTYGNRFNVMTDFLVDNIIKAVRSVDIVSTGSQEIPYDVGYLPYNGLDTPFNAVVTSSEFYEEQFDTDKRPTLGVFSFDDVQTSLFESVNNAPWIYNPIYSQAVFESTVEDGEVVINDTLPKEDIWIDKTSNTIRLVPRWLPEVDCRPYENLQKGSINGTLFRYNDPTLNPEEVDITTAPTTVHFFFYRRREFVDFIGTSNDPYKEIFNNSIAESNSDWIPWSNRSVVKGSGDGPGLNYVINPFGRKTTSTWADVEGGGKEYWYFSASGSGGYFGPSGSEHMAFPDPLDVVDDDSPNWQTFVSNIDFGDGTVSDREQYRNKPLLLTQEAVVTHTYTKPGVHKMTGCMWDMRKNTDEEGGVYVEARNVRTFECKFHLNANPALETNLQINSVPTAVVSGISNYSIYNKSLETFIGYIPPDEDGEEAEFLTYPFKFHYDKLSSAAAAATVDEKYINPDLLTPFSKERYLLRIDGGTPSASYGGPKVTRGLFRNFGSLGDYIGDSDIAQTRLFTKPYRIASHLGFPNFSASIEEASNPDNPKYWDNIIPKDFKFTNREGIDSTEVNGKVLLTIDTSSNQQWDQGYMYPTLPLLNEFGKLDSSLGFPSGSIFYGQKVTWDGNDTQAMSTKEIIKNQYLRIDAQVHEIDDNTILDSAGEGIGIKPIADYKIGVQLPQMEIEFQEPLYGPTTETEDGAY